MANVELWGAVLGSLFGSVLTTVFYYLLVYLYDRKRPLNLTRKGHWIVSKSFLFAGAIVFAGVFVYSFRCLMNLGQQMDPTDFILVFFLIPFLGLTAVTDYRTQIISNRVLLVMLGIWIVVMSLSLLYRIDETLYLLVSSLSAAALAGLAFLLCYFVTKRQMGAGDVKLAAILGLYLNGSRIVGGILFGLIICLIYSVVQMIRRKMTLKSSLPLGPFLFLGSVLVIVLS